MWLHLILTNEIDQKPNHQFTKTISKHQLLTRLLVLVSLDDMKWALEITLSKYHLLMVSQTLNSEIAQTVQYENLFDID